MSTGDSVGWTCAERRFYAVLYGEAFRRVYSSFVCWSWMDDAAVISSKGVVVGDTGMSLSVGCRRSSLCCGILEDLHYLELALFWRGVML